MIEQSNTRKLTIHIIINLTISGLLLVLRHYCLSLYGKSILFHVGTVLYAPGFIIIALLRGPNEALHYTSQETFLIVSFFSYSIIVAIIQFVIIVMAKFARRREVGNNAQLP